MSLSEISQHVGIRYIPLGMAARPGQRLKEFREAEGLSMAALAARVRPAATASNINKLEKGQIDFSMDWARRLGDALGRHPLDFFDAMPKPEPRKAALLNLVEGLSESDQEAVFRHADALAHKSPSKQRDG